MKYYRTYIFKFNTSTGIKVYAGQRTSKYENPVDDPYCGSGVIISNAIKKYGKQCIIEKTWFNHTSEKEMDDAEIELITNVKREYGDDCVNIAGGSQGNVYKYMSKEQLDIVKSKISSSGKNAQNRPETKRLKSEAAKRVQKEAQNRPGVNEKRSATLKLTLQQNPDIRTKISTASKKAQRTSDVWTIYYKSLFELWLSCGGNMKYGKFYSVMKTHEIYSHIPRTQIVGLIRHFFKVVDGSEEPHI